ncbi:class I SAM-dependent methyltransferase [Microbacterium sediminis]|uniref:Methylase n=1 Tax=Microbacterium sediminis TaxID=904291 RepID=A0A1B9N812_9MICO|nr:class I SAM-dependent methyltransferase [Microbacterium sediminis]OCG72742.1 methylase [Microbacterium sediminis]QBR74742.1 class I SAM-dependent methyltransferase [Microbacterium sediminis]
MQGGRAGRVVGRPTRGTTGTNRLRRVDRWIAQLPALRAARDPLVVDLGFGANGVTTLELEDRLRRARPGVDVLGLEIDPDRVEVADAQLAAVRRAELRFSPEARVSFARGGFEVPSPRRPTVIRAFNVLRQYDEADVPDAWARMCARLAPGGVLVEGTCDEIGRVSSWIDVDADARPLRFTISLRLRGLERPSIVAERLPKALIHRNVPGERVHAWLTALDDEWERAAGHAVWGPEQRWLAMIAALRAAGWPIEGGRTRWRLGELTVPWSAVAPLPA